MNVCTQRSTKISALNSMQQYKPIAQGQMSMRDIKRNWKFTVVDASITLIV